MAGVARLQCARIRKRGAEWHVRLLGYPGPWAFKTWRQAIMFADLMTRA